MFEEPLRRDPLVVGWALCLLLGATIALTDTTAFRGGLESARAQALLGEAFLVLLWSVCVLVLLAWLRANWRELLPRRTQREDAVREQSANDRRSSDGRLAGADLRPTSLELVEMPVRLHENRTVGTPTPSTAFGLDIAATVGAGAPVAARLVAIRAAAERRRRRAAILPSGSLLARETAAPG